MRKLSELCTLCGLCPCPNIPADVIRGKTDVCKERDCRLVSVFVSDQQCCGMPTLLEGDKQTTLQRIGSNLEILLETAGAGYDLVCSCPTCRLQFEHLLPYDVFHPLEVLSRAYESAALKTI